MRVFQEKPLQLVPIVCGEKGKGPDAAFLQRALRLGGVQRARTAELNPGHHRVPEKEGKGQQKNAQNRAGGACRAARGSSPSRIPPFRLHYSTYFP